MKRTVIAVALLAGALNICGCSANNPLKGLSSPDPRVRALSAVQAGQQKIWPAVPLLVDRLEDPDPAVRFYAVKALRRITGEQLGYLYYQRADQRRHAVERWRSYVQQRCPPTEQELLAGSNPEP